MSRTVKTKKIKIKEYQTIDLDKKDPRLLSITDSKTKKGQKIQIDKDTLKEYEKSSQDSPNKKIGFNADSRTYIFIADRLAS